MSHNNLIKYIDYINGDKYIYLLCEICNNSLESLKNINIKKKYIPNTDDIINVLNDCVGALLYLHQNDMYHGNIRPDLIYLKENNYKLNGYGIINEYQINTKYPDLYKPPEYNINNLTSEMDIYSLGMSILQYWYNGYINENNLKSLIVKENKKLYELLMKCIDLNPSKRPTCSDILQFIKKGGELSVVNDVSPVINDISPRSVISNTESLEKVNVVFKKLDESKNGVTNEILQNILSLLSEDDNIENIKSVCEKLKERNIIELLCNVFENSDANGGYLIAGILAIIAVVGIILYFIDPEILKPQISLICAICVFYLQQGALIGLKLLQPLLMSYRNIVKNGFPCYIQFIIPFSENKNKEDIILQTLQIIYILIENHGII